MSLGQIMGHPEDARRYEPWDGFVLPACRLGLEFEFEGVRAPELPVDASWSQYWERHEERSIRDGGAEFAFRLPIFGRDAYDAISSLVSYAASQGWRASRRTGIHVHMDARDLSIPQLQGICLLYALYEPAVYRWVGNDRHRNVFCLPWYLAEEGIVDAANVLRTAMTEAVNPGAARFAATGVRRYAGMNLNALSEHGSIEFRQLKTTLNLQDVLNWINIVLSFKLGAYNAPQCDGALLQMIKTQGARQTGRQLLGRTFDLLDYPELEQDVATYGIPTAHQLVVDGIEPPSVTFNSPLPEGAPHEGFRRFMEANRPLADAPPSPVTHRGAWETAMETAMQEIRQNHALWMAELTAEPLQRIRPRPLIDEQFREFDFAAGPPPEEGE